jgi:PAS domain S-box-containing protein
VRQQQLSSHSPREAGANGNATHASRGLAEPWGAEELAATLDSVGTGVWAVDLEGCCVFINQAACRTFGYAREECLGRNLQCKIHHGHSDGWFCPVHNCRIQSALETGSAAWVDHDVFQRRDGTSFPVQYSVQPVVVQGRLRGAVISMADISLQKSAEEALRKSDEWLRLTQRIGSVGLFDLDLTTGEARASAAQFGIYGLDPAAKWPSHEEWRKMVHPEDVARMDREIELAISGATVPGTEFRVVWPDGSIHWLFGQPNVSFDEAGKPVRLVGVNFDITSRVRAEAVLNQFFSASPTPMSIWEFDGRIRKANPAWTSVLGFAVAELEERPVLDLVHPEDRAAAAAEFEKLSVSGKRMDFECRVRCQDGSYRRFLLNAIALADARLIYVTAHDVTQRRAAEEALRQSEARFRSAFENTLFGMAITGLDGRFLQVNQSLCRMTGFSEHELQQREFIAITHPDDVRENLEFLRALTSGEISSGTTTKRYVRKDGKPLWVCIHVAVERDTQGRPHHYIALIEDLTERRRAEEDARRSEEWLGCTLESAGVGLCRGESGRTTASEEQFRLYGLEPAKTWLSRERWLELIHPADRVRVDIEQRQAVEQRRPYAVEFRTIWPDGSVHWLLSKGKILPDDTVTRRIEVTVDVTERKRAEIAMEAFFCLSRSPKSVFGFDGSIKRLNTALLEMSGFTAEEFAQHPITDFFHPDDRAAMKAEFQRLSTEGGNADFECRCLRKDGSCVWLLFSATAAPDEKLIFTTAHDITERKRMEKALQLNLEKLSQSNEELERFAYVASHDLQEPLRMVASFTQLLAQRYSGRLDETADRYIHYAVDGAKRMQELIGELLAYSRLNSKELEIRRTDCAAVVLEAMRNLQAAIEESGASIDMDPLPELSVDQGQLTQLFQNLLSNSIKFRRKDECPRIHVSSVDSGAEWVISVRDNGIGMDTRQAERAFQIFQRLHTRAEYPGTGIGLAVCKKVVERHGGRIWVESEPGAGSTFRFTIPKPGRNEIRGESAN